MHTASRPSAHQEGKTASGLTYSSFAKTLFVCREQVLAASPSQDGAARCHEPLINQSRLLRACRSGLNICCSRAKPNPCMPLDNNLRTPCLCLPTCKEQAKGDPLCLFKATIGVLLSLLHFSLIDKTLLLSTNSQ